MSPRTRAILSSVILLQTVGLLAYAAYSPAWKVRQQESSRERIGLMTRSACTHKHCEETEYVVLERQLAKEARDLAAESKKKQKQEREWRREERRELGQDASTVHHEEVPYAEEMKTLAAKRARLRRLGRVGQATFLTLLASAAALLGLAIAFIVVWRRSRGQSTRITLLGQGCWLVATLVLAMSAVFYTGVHFLELPDDKTTVTEAGIGFYLALASAVAAVIGGLLAHLSAVKPTEPSGSDEPESTD